jgi:RNA polymerase sigma-70 factor (ECF subfamily)
LSAVGAGDEQEKASETDFTVNPCNLRTRSSVIANRGVDIVRLDFDRIVAENQSMVFSLAVRFLRDREGAEELAQDVFLQIYQQLGRIETPAHATWWLRRAICHRCIDEVRKRRLRPGVGLEDVPEPVARDKPTDPFLSARLRGLVESLPEKARAVVLLRYQEDMDPSEISEMLEMPLSTVKSHLHRSLTLLRGKLRKREEELCR